MTEAGEARRGKTAVRGLFVVAGAFGHPRNHDSEGMALKHPRGDRHSCGHHHAEVARLILSLAARPRGERIGMSCRRHAELPVGC
jgi:hypothetical protein